MDEKKDAQFRKLFGDKIGNLILGTAKSAATAAEDAGLRSKATEQQPAATDTSTPAAPAAEPAQDPGERKLSDLTVKEFAGAIGAAFKAALAENSTATAKSANDAAAALVNDVRSDMLTLAETLGEKMKEQGGKLDTLLGEQPASQRVPAWRASQDGPAVNKGAATMPGVDESLKSLVDTLDLGMRRS